MGGQHLSEAEAVRLRSRAAPDGGRGREIVEAFYAVVRFEAPAKSRIDCQIVSAYIFDLIDREYGHVNDVTVVKDPARCAACEALVESQFPGDMRLGSAKDQMTVGPSPTGQDPNGKPQNVGGGHGRPSHRNRR